MHEKHVTSMPSTFGISVLTAESSKDPRKFLFLCLIDASFKIIWSIE